MQFHAQCGQNLSAKDNTRTGRPIIFITIANLVAVKAVVEEAFERL